MEYDLINTIVSGIVAAFVCGMVAKKIKLPAIIGYLVAGIIIGPNTPGFVADIGMAQQLAEIGIILLMFGVGLHFSFRDFSRVKKIALPGAIAQIIIATIFGAMISKTLGYELAQSLVFGFALSVASTIVLLRSLEQKKLLDTEGGKVAIGWLIIEDIAMVIGIVLIPVMADLSFSNEQVDLEIIAKEIFMIIGKIALFFLFMMVVGRKLLPLILVQVGKKRSAELRTLSVLAIALGFSYIAYIVFDASLALGSFLAGMVLNESKIGHKSAESSTPLRDIFSVLFFVSVGMLFKPIVLIQHPIAVLSTIFTIIIVKSLVAYLIARLFRQNKEVCYIVAIGLAQIGEFSFILGSLALSKGLISDEMHNIILASAMISIIINSFLFNRYEKRYRKKSS